MLAVKCATKYAIELPRMEFLRIFKRDKQAIEKDTRSLVNELNLLGAIEVEYDCHFGPRVYFTIYVDDDDSVMHANIRALITRWTAPFSKKRKVKQHA